jgi:hypothetical protein
MTGGARAMSSGISLRARRTLAEIEPRDVSLDASRVDV